ncbi:uncharacterized protein FIBRA_00467 [Fibroporia radiculosa]|uniref:J domain-containing protein n=1 Tax=Fibroporia radiculosa TaxID=599839 RepID=J4H019_9APHY|nr:uncharacterized protein FIBRA_00467 [Fibroporia radiculosa]CCL98469.1 predicted protein [Fibroporia radiculosa]
MKSGKYDRAAVLLTNAICEPTASDMAPLSYSSKRFEAIDSSTLALFTSRGVALAQSHDFNAAIADFNTAISKGLSLTSEEILWMARSHLYLGSTASALFIIEDVLRLDPQNEDARALRKRLMALEVHIQSYQKAQSCANWRAARTAYQSCLTIFAEENGPLPVQFRCWGIELQLAECDWEKAVSGTEYLLSKEPEAVQVITLRAVVLLLVGNCSEALLHLAVVLRLDPDNKNLLALRTRCKDIKQLQEEGETLGLGGKWSEAIRKWNEALTLVGEKGTEGGGGPLRAKLLHRIANGQLKLGQLSDGLRTIDSALKLDQVSPRAHIVRGRLHLALRLYDLAVDDLKAAVQYGISKLNQDELAELQAELASATRKAAAERGRPPNYYSVLGLPRRCTASDIRKAYTTQALKHHPDKGGMEEMFKRVFEAYSVLKDPKARRSYDATLSASHG